MMQSNYILDENLPLTLDFEALKEKGLAYIQAHSSTAWTNLNPSDPGVTILDQLCYAFTELGYCMNFPVKDILTDKKGNLITENQFYTPDKILTTSAITINDYCKYIIDQVDGVKNTIILPLTTNFYFVNGVYEVYVYIDSNVIAAANESEETTINNILTATFFALNTNRNLGEYFLKPKALQSKNYRVQGILEVAHGYDYNTILATINQQINAYVFPDVVQTGYDKLAEEGVTTNTIFNGPILENGWIPDASIQPKKDRILAFEITKIIQEIEGVTSIMSLSFSYNGITTTEAIAELNEILVFDFVSSLAETDGMMKIMSSGRSLNFSNDTSFINELSSFEQPKDSIEDVAAVAMTPKLPEGKFRDISDYYSIQNTFPASFAVGGDAVNDNASDFQIAQSRQLKGYLTIYDQMLTNQFAQLANIPILFSFKNATTGTYADTAAFYAVRDAYQKEHLEYPVPYESFAPTYFYQSLYKSVPHIQPLLRNNNTFNFSLQQLTDHQLEKQSEKAYQDDPYNTYIWGLMAIMENEQVNLNRRNDILNHLLARHGVSPMILDSIIYSTIYSGNLLKDQIIIKSLYLQNYGLLSYNSNKAYNYLGANKIDATLYKVTKKDIQQILAERQNDFIFNSSQIDEQEKITAQHTIDYSTIELKLSLLFALAERYKNFIVEKHKNLKKRTAAYEIMQLRKSIASWLITQRKGMLALETNLLLSSARFTVVFKLEITQLYVSLSLDFSYDEFVVLDSIIAEIECDDDITVENIVDTISEKLNVTISIRQSETEVTNDIRFKSITKTISYAVMATWNSDFSICIQHPLFDVTSIILFPDFIPELQVSAFKTGLNTFLESQLPIQVDASYYYIEDTSIGALIPLYTAWFNALRYDSSTTTQQSDDLAIVAGNLVRKIVELNIITNG